MKTRKMKVTSAIKALLTYCFLFSICFTVKAVYSIELKPGVWEGVKSNGMEYIIIEIGDDGKHRLFKTKIATAFKKSQVQSFSEQQVICNVSECIINIVANNNEITRLILTPYLDTSYNVLEINADSEGKPILSRGYQVDAIEKQSSVRQFIEQYSNKLTVQNSTTTTGINGFWLGTVTLDNKPELITLEVNPDKKSHLLYFVNGSNSVVTTSFLPEQLSQIDNVIYVDTEHRLFANKLIINKQSENQLTGYFYSNYNGQTLQTGRFSMIRLSRKFFD